MRRLRALTLRRVAATRPQRPRIPRQAAVTPRLRPPTLHQAAVTPHPLTPHRAAVTPHLPIPRQAAVTPHRPIPRRAVATAAAGAGITAVVVAEEGRMVVAAVAEEVVPEAVVEDRTEAALTDAKSSSYGPPQILGRVFFVRCVCDTACHNSSAAQVFTRSGKVGPFLIGHKENVRWSHTPDAVHTRNIGPRAPDPTK